MASKNSAPSNAKLDTSNPITEVKDAKRKKSLAIAVLKSFSDPRPPLKYRMGQLVSVPTFQGSTNGIVCGFEWGGTNMRLGSRPEWFYYVYSAHNSLFKEAITVVESNVAAISA